MSRKGRMSRNRARKLALRNMTQKREPDLDIQLVPQTEEADVEIFTKTYKQDRDAAAVKGLDEGPLSPLFMREKSDKTFSYGASSHPPDHSIAKSLLNAGRWKSHAGLLRSPEETIAALKPDDRPLIDLLHEATFTSPPGMVAIKDPYALRMLLRKAHCFTLDDATSAMIADFSLATVTDLDATRQMAIPPFPVTWIELDNHARLNRMKALKAPLETDDPNNPPAKRVGWLIHPSPEASGWYATYVTHIDFGIWVAPMSYWWHTDAPNPERPDFNKTGKMMEWLAFGTEGNVGAYDAFIHPSNLHLHYKSTPADVLVDAMREMAGELRHVWGFLVALGAGHLGASVQYTPQAAPTSAPPIMKNGKPLLPLEHKILHLHLNKKPPAKIIAQSITHHHNRRHDVRAHWRLLKSGRRVPVKSHQRGDELLGRIEKTYRVER